jgi:RNA polymerase sigma-70 factor (ECF subfamily)
VIRRRDPTQYGAMRSQPRDVPDPDTFVEDLLPVVAAWCARLAGPGVDADAAAHDVLLVLIRRRGDLRHGAPVEPWAFGITRRVLRAHARTAWLRRWIPGGVADRPAPSDPHRDYAAAERARLVRSVLGALSADHREVLVLCDVEERGRGEVAALLGLPEGTVKSRLRLARAAFRAEAERRGVTFLAVVEDGDG